MSSPHLNTLYLGHLSRLSGMWRTIATPILLEELGQQPLADMVVAGCWDLELADVGLCPSQGHSSGCCGPCAFEKDSGAG